ncbi:condensation domain-containing protein [Snodgrassella gandavensis]|uniref:condensation domain-containing protein n=1 Tax=Snodgrassella gandavensis TaxID=2946698 RepID=UPI001EF60CBF|nr:condensation domain-containing protein [Snodgrassella gandavensis]
MGELTSMQSACWFGRAHSAMLGGVAAHLYTEFNGRHIDVAKLRQAIVCLYRRHELLRLQLSAEGEVSISNTLPLDVLEIDDFLHLSEAQQQQKLAQKRQQWTHQQLKLEEGQTVRFSISLLANQVFRLHIDADMIAVDPSSFRILMEDLAQFYADSNVFLPPPPSFYVWRSTMQQDKYEQQQQQRARQWWQARIAAIAPAPALPLNHSATAAAQSTRLNATLNAGQMQQLRQLACQHRLTFSALMLGLFAYSLGKVTHDAAYRLNVPFFRREPLLPDIDKTIGDFADMVLLNIDMAEAPSLHAFCQRVAAEWRHCLDYRQFSGVNVMRHLSRHHATPQMAPVVFTAALDLPEKNLFSSRVHKYFGSMDWCISQGPQVALDAQFVQLNNHLLINWDIRLDALPQTWVNGLFERCLALINALIAQPERFTQPLQALSQHLNLTVPDDGATPLNALQKAYLSGRSTAFALGGVAMQEFREYAGTLDLPVFRQRLADMVQHHASLRTYIDARRCVQWVNPQAIINLTEINLCGEEPALAAEKIATLRQHYQQALFDLQESPWDITLFQLTPQQFVLFARFDALILDGRAIAALMCELFTTTPLIAASSQPESRQQQDGRYYDLAAAYWQQRLQAITSIPQLPWKQPLATLMTSSYSRQSAVLPRHTFQTLCRLGSQQGLFKNSLLMALILAVLNRWQQTPVLLSVAVPVLPLYEGELSNQSTFIVATWPSTAAFIEQARKLQADTLEGLQHLAFSGVELARMLFEQHGQAPVLPVVITNGLSWPTLPSDKPVHYVSGLTQTPQVAIDIRFMLGSDGALLFNVDYAQAAISDAIIRDFLAALVNVCQQVADSGLENIDSVLPQAPSAAALNPDTHSATAAAWQQQQLMLIYRKVLHIEAAMAITASQPFSQLGLRSAHVKEITGQINQIFRLALTPRQLIGCRNIEEVAHLLQSVMASA